MKKIDKQIKQYLVYCEDVKKLSKSTLLGYEHALRLLAASSGIREVSRLTNSDIEEWIKGQGEKNGSTLNVYLVSIKTFVRYWRRHGEKVNHVKLDELPRVKETPKRKVYYSREQIQKVLDECDELTWLLIRLCFDCGFRIAELASLKLENIDGRKVSFIGKGRKVRETYMSEEARRRLDDWIQEMGVTDNLWIVRFKNGKTRVLCKKRIDADMREAFKRAGFNDFHPHALRHSFATEICRNGAPIDVAKEMLGHANIQTTVRYVHSLEGHLEDLFMKYKFAENA